MHPRTRAAIAPFLLSFAITCIFFIDFCSLMFACGCRSLWAGADTFCNIHQPSGHRCPWCVHGVPGYVVVMTLVSVPQLAASILVPGHWTIRAIVSLTMGVISGALVALLFGWASGYWM